MNKKTQLKLLFACAVLILVIVIIYSGLQILESTVFFKYKNPEQTESKIIEKDGVKYYPRQDITTFLLMGINQSGPVQPTEYNHGGSVDMLALMVFDTKTQTCNILTLNRDMMVNMPMLNRYGKKQGTYYGQLAYSHTYGDGMKDSCENVRNTVSTLFNGIRIDHYLSLNMDTIPILNDSVGGVVVNVVDDFSGIDPTITMGTVKLLGKHAVNFVQARGGVGDELNISRMRRQKEYMESFVEAARKQVNSEPQFLANVYEQILDYIVTDCSLQTLNRLQMDFGSYRRGEILSVEGENRLGEVYYEFYPNEEALLDLTLDLFYAPME
jgi:LCP family protein required for cell wall assembly